MTIPPESFGGRGTDPRVEAVRDIARLARDDRRRGIRYWFDPALAEDLRELVREAGSGAPPRTTARRAGSAASGSAPPPAPAGAATGWSATAAAKAAAARDADPVAGGRADPAPTRAADPTPPMTPPASADPATPASDEAAPDPRVPRWGPPPLAEGRDPDWADQLRALNVTASGCTACDLCKTRRTVVFGTGSAEVPLLFVGEAPGADEDAQGIPFVGRSGQLLTKIIAAIGLRREDVYIANVIKCRPPDNRNPAPDEIERCSPFLARQLEILKPKVICTLGLFATQALLETNLPIGKLRGRLITHKGLKVLPTYHPAALLRNPGYKATVWEDVQLLRKILDQ